MYSLKGQQGYSGIYSEPHSQDRIFHRFLHLPEEQHCFKDSLSFWLSRCHPFDGPSLPFYSFVWVWFCACERSESFGFAHNRGLSQWPLALPCTHPTPLSAAPCFWSLWYLLHSPKTHWKTGWESEKWSECSTYRPDEHGRRHQTAWTFPAN